MDQTGETAPDSQNAGGGGGGAGRVRINATNMPTIAGMVSPAPTIGPVPSLILPLGQE